MFNQRQWDELNAFAASFAPTTSSNSTNSQPQSHHHHHPQQQQQQQQQPQQHDHQFQHHDGAGNHHALQHQPQQQPQFIQHHQQVPAPAPQPQYSQQEHHQTFQYEFSPQQDWPKFDINSSSTVPSDAAQQPLNHHDGARDFGAAPSGDMDWAPTSDFNSSFQHGFGGGQQAGGAAAPPEVKMELDGMDLAQGSHGESGSVGAGRGVGRLIAQFESKDFQPPLPPRPTNTTSSNNNTNSTSDNAATTSPIAINQQQPSSHYGDFHAAPQGHSFASTPFAGNSFASNRVASPDEPNYGSFGAAHSQPRVTSPVATSPPSAPFGSFHGASQVTSPAAAPSSNPFGSLDGFMSNSGMGHSMSTSPMVTSPPPTTSAQGTSGTPGFAIWRPPGQQEQQPPQQPQPQPQQYQVPEQFYQLPPSQQQAPEQFYQQPSLQQQHQPQPSVPYQHPHQNHQNHQTSQQPSQQPVQHPLNRRASNVTSPGAYFPPPVPSTPKPPMNAGNQFILELNPGSKAKGKAPVKPPKPKAPKPTLPVSTPGPFSPSIKQEPETPQPSAMPSSSSNAPDQPNEDQTARPPIGSRTSREQVPPEAWESFKSTIRDLYLEQRKPLKEVMSIMAEKYNFQATPKMYKTRFSQWGFVKNNTEDEVKKLLSMKFQRDAKGKVSEFMRNGKIVNLGTYLKRKGVTEYDLVDFELPANLPSHIRCRTPTPPPAPEYLKSPDLVRAQELVVGNMRKAFLQCRQWELETERQVGWPSTMVWGAPSSEMLTEANFYFEAGDADTGGQCLLNAFNQLELDLKQLSPQAIMEVMLGMVRRDPGLMTALCKYVAAFSTTNYDRSHPLRQIFTCLYEVQQKHGAATLSELLWGSTPLIAEELEAIYGRRHPYVARTWIDLAVFYEQKNAERLEKLGQELRIQHRQMEQSQGTETTDLVALRYAIAQLLYSADADSESTRQAAKDLWKDMTKGKLVFRVRDSRTNVYCYHCAVKIDPGWSKRCRRRYDSVVELLEKHVDVKVHPYFEEDFHTLHHELESQDAWAAALGQQIGPSRWGFI